MSIEEKAIAVGQLEWFYREATPESDRGKPPVLLLHGLPAQSYSWREVMAGLASEGFHCLAPDWLGFGRSSKPDRREFAYTPTAYEEALAKLLAALEWETFSLVVQGFLATAGLQYALHHAEQIERLIVLNTPLGQQVQLPWQIRQLGLPLLGDMITQDPLQVERILEAGSGFVIAETHLQIYRQPFLKNSAAGRALKTATANLNLSEAIAKIEQGLTEWRKPTLLIWGMADPWLESRAAETLASQKSNIELTQLPEAKHYPQEHWSAEIAPAIANFLRRQVG